MARQMGKGGYDGTRRERPMVFLHIGDLHMTALEASDPLTLVAREKQIKDDLTAIVADINSIHHQECVDFVYQPGDLAENGHAAEYTNIFAILSKLQLLKVKLIPGDHDRAFGNLSDFAKFRALFEKGQQLPKPRKSLIVDPPTSLPEKKTTSHITQYYFEEMHGDVLCIFLDTVSAGRGQKGWGLDFRLGRGQFDWLVGLLERHRGKPSAVFMHCYPADFAEPDEGAELGSVIWSESLRTIEDPGIDDRFRPVDGIRLVEMGHTHYNEIGHDGRTLYGSVRSVGQNEDGPPGYGVVVVDGEVTSWRYRQTQQTWPFVMVTSPADRRLATAPLKRDANGHIGVRALVLSDQGFDDPKFECACRVDTGPWIRMRRVGDTCTFEAKDEQGNDLIEWSEGSRVIQVRVADSRFPDFGKDFIDFDTIEPATCHPDRFTPKSLPQRPGSDACAVGSWPVKGIRGDQLGPNKLGRKW